MMLITTFRQQHEQIEQVAADISRELDTLHLKLTTGTIRKKIHDLLTCLKIHISLETDSLYVALLHHQNRQIADEAGHLMQESKLMSEKIDQYSACWLSPGHIEHRPDVFIAETQSLLAVLQDHFIREDKDLFSQIERESVH
jgi:hypothetical protein